MLVISPSPEGLQQSINVIKKHAEEWKLKVNTKKSNVIIFSGNGQNKNKENFKFQNEPLHIVDRQTYLGIEMTSHGRYTYVRDILSKKACKVLSTIKRSFSNSDTTTITIKNKLLMLLSNLFYYMDAKFGDLNYYHIRLILTKALLNKSILSAVNKH